MDGDQYQFRNTCKLKQKLITIQNPYKMQGFTTVALLCAVLLFIGLPETTLAFTEPVPMDNMTLEKCGSSCPQKSCDNRDVDETICTQNCVEGYRCNSGYIRRSVPNGPCVLPENCPAM